jgi:hypothetical protein
MSKIVKNSRLGTWVIQDPEQVGSGGFFRCQPVILSCQHASCRPDFYLAISNSEIRMNRLSEAYVHFVQGYFREYIKSIQNGLCLLTKKITNCACAQFKVKIFTLFTFYSDNSEPVPVFKNRLMTYRGVL